MKYKFLLIFNLLIEAETNNDSFNQDTEYGIPDIPLTLAAKLLQLLHNNIYSLKLPDIIKKDLKKSKAFIKKNKDVTNENDSKNGLWPEAETAESSSTLGEAMTIKSRSKKSKKAKTKDWC